MVGLMMAIVHGCYELLQYHGTLTPSKYGILKKINRKIVLMLMIECSMLYVVCSTVCTNGKSHKFPQSQIKCVTQTVSPNEMKGLQINRSVCVRCTHTHIHTFLYILSLPTFIFRVGSNLRFSCSRFIFLFCCVFSWLCTNFIAASATTKTTHIFAHKKMT